jgi:hypothetical protein
MPRIVVISVSLILGLSALVLGVIAYYDARVAPASVQTSQTDQIVP